MIKLLGFSKSCDGAKPAKRIAGVQKELLMPWFEVGELNIFAHKFKPYPTGFTVTVLGDNDLADALGGIVIFINFQATNIQGR